LITPPAAIERLKALIDEARWVLTDSDLEQIKPVSTPAEIEQAIRFIRYGLMNEDALRASHPFTRGDWHDRPDASLLRVLRDPEYFPFACYHLFRQPDGQPVRLMPYQHITLMEFWWRQMVMLVASRGAGKSWLLAMYILLKLTFHQGTEIAVVSKTLRQSKILWSYAERLWNNSPVFRSLVGPFANAGTDRKNGPRQAASEGRYEFIIGDSIALFLPMGPDGEGIRGIRSQCTITDEFGSLDPEVYSVVVAGFGAVAGDPVYKAGQHARLKTYERLGLSTEEMKNGVLALTGGNQQIIAGTATYQFNHFYQYLKSYSEVIQSRGDPERLQAIFNGPPPPGFDWRRYSVIRLPWSMLPKGFMDEATIGRAKQLAATNEYIREYEAGFPSDSDGFFRRSNIEKCTIGGLDLAPPEFPSGMADFTVSRAGDPLRRYVYGVDPAAQKDNFAVVIIELWPDHRRVVKCWTTKLSEHRKQELASANYYQYAVDELRAMFAKWPPAAVVIDAQGGGGTIREMFREPKAGEVGYYAVDDEAAAHLPGEHILHMFQFASANDTSEANWGLQKDLETRSLLFPRGSALEYALAEVAGEDLVESLEEIDALKDELTNIVREQTPGGRERWDVPGGPRGHVRKDRYSALVMASWMAKRMAGVAPAPERPDVYGGLVAELASLPADQRADGPMYVLDKRCKPDIRARARGTWYG
jgi:hypothetical protein